MNEVFSALLIFSHISDSSTCERLRTGYNEILSRVLHWQKKANGSNP